jgi:hypothetical protein
LKPEARERTGAIEYEEVVSILSAHGETDLSEWLRERILAGTAARATAADNDSDRRRSDRIVPIEKAP